MKVKKMIQLKVIGIINVINLLLSEQLRETEGQMSLFSTLVD